ncbi:MAG: HNH endonuclease signature motif containing protein [Oligoflexia bacterium]|nr:HNH endonuclease signature motif containing protein [Oligoflexia bacterium]
MNIKTISDQVLWDLTRSKVQQERNLTLEIIELLREVRSRRLHLERGYESFHQYCVKELKYDDGAAHRRIKALDLVCQIPEVVQCIQTGTLSLTTASQMQNFFNQEAKKDKTYTKEEKLELVISLESKSKREIEKTLATLAPETLKQTEKVRYVSGTHLKVELVIDEVLMKKIQRLKNITSHKNKTIRDLIESLFDDALEKKDPEVKALKILAKNNKAQKAQDLRRDCEMNVNLTKANFANANLINADLANAEAVKKAFPEKYNPPSQRSRYIPALIKRQVWVRAKSQCTFIDPVSKFGCQANRFLQTEHIIPFALGGTSTLDNLTLLCSNHNKLKALHTFGKSTMNRYMES